ncbi:PKD domain-containing protein [Methanoregula sp.]|uniref:PKD domain-containing protein n=1 Tax=Methanoregula sp. TaxID=2052170 RepID=UPI002629AE97|nr:PKD domain-containing protein [Methanoregula sp.]MDD5143930.1 PKD domain-containing protein [Methanoregula sp.]
MHNKQFLLLVLILTAGLLTVPACAAAAETSGPGYITVTNPPVAEFFSSTRLGPAPLTVSFADTSRGFSPMEYHWDFGDGSTSDRENPTHTYTADGEYTVRLTVTNIYGTDTRSEPVYIQVGNPPVAGFSAFPVEGIVPLSVSFSDTSVNRPVAWQWEFGDGATSKERSPLHSYAVPGTYTVRLRVSNAFGSDTLSRTDLISAGSIIPVESASDTGGPVRKEGIIGLIQEAKGPAATNLPASAYIPAQFMALAAVITSIAVLVIQVIVANIAFIWQVILKFMKFFADLIGGHAIEKLSEKEIAARKIAARKMEQHYFGLSATEVLVIEIAIIVVALAFMLADRAELTLDMVLIYIAVGAVSVLLHDFAHRYIATQHGQDADTQFWGLGTVIMFVTAWLFGNAFGASYRNLVNRNDDENPRTIGIEMVAGPVVSIILTFVFLAMVMVGGIWAVAGGIGFTINLITAVYSLMPIETMDGLAIWRWNKSLYLALFIPLFAFYCAVFLLI